MSEESEIKRKNDFFRKIKNLLISKDALVFLLFLVLSGTFWFVQSLDKQRETTLKIPVDYMGIPEDVELENKLPQRIEIKVRDEGLTLMKYNSRNTVPLALDLERVYFAKGKIVITADQLKNRISRYVLPTTAVLEIKPDSIVVLYHKLASVTLPVRLSGEVKLSSQYVLSDSIQIEPSTVKIFGPKNIVDTMRAVYTEKLDTKSLTDTTFTKVRLEKPKDGIRYAFSDVNVGIFVEMFTENKLEMPVTVINAPENINVRIFPPTVYVTYNVGLSNFNKVRENDIKVIFDYKEAKDLDKRRYKLQIIQESHYISNLRVTPAQVEFLFEEK